MTNVQDILKYLPECDMKKSVIDALEKQIPKKPVPFVDRGKHYIGCPTCGFGGVGYMHDDNFFVIVDFEHCFNCGQAIDWGEDE